MASFGGEWELGGREDMSRFVLLMIIIKASFPGCHAVQGNDSGSVNAVCTLKHSGSGHCPLGYTGPSPVNPPARAPEAVIELPVTMF